MQRATEVFPSSKMPTIKLQSSDSEVFPVDVEVILTIDIL